MAQIAEDQVDHIFRGMRGPERLKIKLQCSVCNEWREFNADTVFEFVMIVPEIVDDPEERAKMLGGLCAGCVALPLQIKWEKVKAACGKRVS